MKAQCLRGFFGFVIIPLHYGRTAYYNLAVLSVRLLFKSLRVNDFIIHIRVRNTDTSRFVAVCGNHAAAGHALGQAVAFANLNIGAVRF